MRQVKDIISLPCIIREYEFLEVLGHGGYSTVYKVNSLYYKELFAAKVMVIDPLKWEQSESSFKAEIEALKKLDHPNIIRLYDYFMEENKLFQILEYCPNGSLNEMVNESGGKGHARRQILDTVCFQIISAIEVCHAEQIAHRDIKLSNVLLDSNGRTKLADFGISAHMSSSKNNENNYNKFNGSLLYSPPEIFRKVAYNPFKADMWALGVTIYWLIMGHAPFPSDNMKILKSAVEANNYEPLPVELHHYSELIKKMLVNDPDKRSNIHQIATLFSQMTKQPEQIPLAKTCSGISFGIHVSSFKSSTLEIIAGKRRKTSGNFSRSFLEKKANIAFPLRCMSSMQKCSLPALK